ncbi:hypothetical protein [Cytobacillus sp. NCCP-133]|uniref:hypothetical protein n=1 Tax=Cytobacillus sp. NCCP-133 TaxID=766848 RepID=UPI0022326F56|nr:hypothetical protein [Cytobacillus sp. NCCP-133]GLB58671.1 hypothetical protein NCCP133_08040 [Cytobacillus sp. NCCP-133]
MNTNSLIANVLKSITVQGLAAGILLPEKFNKFVDEMQEDATVLAKSRLMTMNSPKLQIDRISLVGRVLRAGAINGVHNVLSEDQYAEYNTAMNELIAREFQATTSIYDNALRSNIEKTALEGHILQLLGRAAGVDFEELAFFGDKSSSDTFLNQTDGWIKKGKNKIYGAGTTPDFDKETSTAIFKSLKAAYPKPYLTKRKDKLAFLVSYEVEENYRDELKARPTTLGDQTLVNSNQLAYDGIPVIYVPVFERSAIGRVAMLVDFDNLVYGIFHEVTVEPSRKAEERKTNFVLTMEGDVHYENENVVAIALLDQAKPTA